MTRYSRQRRRYYYRKTTPLDMKQEDMEAMSKNDEIESNNGAADGQRKQTELRMLTMNRPSLLEVAHPIAVHSTDWR